MIAKGYAPAPSDPINTDEDDSVTVRLTRGGSLAGSVVNDDGEPVSDAVVIPLSIARGNMPRESDLFLSEEGAVQTVDGRFVFEHLPPGQETLKVVHPDYCPAVVKTADIVEGLLAENPDVVLNRGGGIEGFVYDATGRPQAKVTVNVQDERAYTGGEREAATRLGRTVTDANGFYRIDGLPADRLCRVMRQESGQALGVVQRAGVPVMGQVVRFDLGGTTILRGVLSKDGAPLPLTRLHVSGPDASYSSAFQYLGMTDDHGRFELHGVPPGRYGLYYERPGGRTDLVRACVVAVADENIDLGTIDLRTTRVGVTLRSADPAAAFSFWQVFLQEGTDFWRAHAGVVDEAASTESLRVIKDVSPGTYQVVARQSDVAIRKRIVVELAGGPPGVELEIPRATATVSGTFITDTGQPLILWNSARTVTAHLRSQDGAFAVGPLPAGHYTVGNYFLTDRASVLEFDVREGETKTVDIDVTQWCPDLSLLVLCVVGRNGTVLNHAAVWLEGVAGRIGAEPGVAGGYTFTPRPGDYTLFVQCEGYAPYIEPLTLPRTGIGRAASRQSPRIIRLNPR